MDVNLTRRDFIVVAATAAIWRSAPGDVVIVQFSNDGARQGAVHVAKVVKSGTEWKRWNRLAEFLAADRRGKRESRTAEQRPYQ
jgi:hypothetical protein